MTSAFLSHHKTENSVCDTTLMLYSRALQKFFDFIGGTDRNITEKRLEMYRAHIASQDTKIRTKNLALIPVRCYLDYLREIEKQDVPEKQKLKLFGKKLHPLPLVIPTQEQLQEFLKSRDPQYDLIAELLYNTGLRIFELLSRRKGEIQEAFTIVGKRGKQRPVYCTPELVARVQEYERENRIQEGSPVFTASKRGVEKHFARRSKGVAVKFTPHTMRHLFATHLLRKGANILEVQKMLGHEKIATTEIYLNYSNADLQATYKRIWRS